MTSINRGFIANQPGLMVANSLTHSSQSHHLTLMIVYNTDTYMNLRRGTVVALASPEIGPGDTNLGPEIANVTQTKGNQAEHEDLKLTDLSVSLESRDTVLKLGTANKDLFAAKDSQPGRTSVVQMKIDLNGHPPIKLKPYRVPLQNKPVIDKALDEMIEAGVIRKSTSNFAFPVVIVDKKDGSKRFCVDFRQLNKVTKVKRFPLPLIDDLLAVLTDAKYFTTLDLKSGF